MFIMMHAWLTVCILLLELMATLPSLPSIIIRECFLLRQLKMLMESIVDFLMK